MLTSNGAIEQYGLRIMSKVFQIVNQLPRVTCPLGHDSTDIRRRSDQPRREGRIWWGSDVAVRLTLDARTVTYRPW